jgi:hypothetical protein
MKYNTEAHSKHGDNKLNETSRYQLCMTCKMGHSEGNERKILQSKSDDWFQVATAPSGPYHSLLSSLHDHTR